MIRRSDFGAPVTSWNHSSGRPQIRSLGSICLTNFQFEVAIWIPGNAPLGRKVERRVWSLPGTFPAALGRPKPSGGPTRAISIV